MTQQKTEMSEYKAKFTRQGDKDYELWQKHNRSVVRRIDELIEDMEKHPFEGKGKPEPLKENLQGYWSRRITDKHRITYIVKGNLIIIARCRGHYE